MIDAARTPSFGQVWTVRDGKVARVQMYPNRAEMLAAVGLIRSEPGA